MILPEEYISKMKELLKDEFDLYIDSFNEKSHLGLRANTLKTTPEELKTLLNIPLEPVPWCPEGYYYSDSERPAKSPYYYAGLFYIQEPSAMSTAALLPINENDRVLDLCAAPGGKSTQIAAKLKGTGVLVSNDISASRCKALLKNIELSGVSNAVVANETPEKLAIKFKGFFDKIIIDAPCSGEGMFRKDAEAVKNWCNNKSDMYCDLQRDILHSAKDMLCDGGIIAYSTCTFSPEENEAIIDEFIQNNPEFELLEVNKSLGFSDGNPLWTQSKSTELKKCGRLWPYKIKGEGHFLALIKKKDDQNKEIIQFNSIEKIKDENLKYFYEFMLENMNFEISENLKIHGTSLMQIPFGLNLDKLRIVRSGLLLGELKTKRFEPSQAFAMTLKKDDVKNSISFNIDDQRVIRYLKGESFEVENCNDGWNLVLLDRFPLGWCKVQKGRLKNKYLAGWRM